MAHDPHDHDSPEYFSKQSNLSGRSAVCSSSGTCITVWLHTWTSAVTIATSSSACCIATVKAALVALIFMHLKGERGLIYKFLAFTVIFVIGLFALTYLAWTSPLFHRRTLLTTMSLKGFHILFIVARLPLRRRVLGMVRLGCGGRPAAGCGGDGQSQRFARPRAPRLRTLVRHQEKPDHQSMIFLDRINKINRTNPNNKFNLRLLPRSSENPVTSC